MDALYTIEAPQGAPTLAKAAQILRVRETDLDPGFGVVLIDPKRNLYSVRVRTRSGAKPDGSAPGTAGPFADPGIGMFGPPEDGGQGTAAPQDADRARNRR